MKNVNVLGEGWMAIADAARAVGCNATTVRAWVRSGHIKSARIVGRHRAVQIDELRAYNNSDKVAQEREMMRQRLKGGTMKPPSLAPTPGMGRAERITDRLEQLVARLEAILGRDAP